MSNKLIVILIGISALILVGIGVVVLMKKNAPSSSPVSEESFDETSTQQITVDAPRKKYTDPSGFAFQYPDTVTVSPKKTIPSSSYAVIDIISSTQQGTLTIKLEDTTFKTLNEALSSITTTKETVSTPLKIADLDGLQTDYQGKRITVALDERVLLSFTLEGGDAKFWSEIYDTVLSTFTFEQPDTSVPSETVGATSDNVVLEEEIVE